MSGREWKPGDVALAECMGMEIRGIIDTDGRFYTTDQRVDGVSSSAFALGKLRPLVVVDPEDREQVERLARAHAWMGDNALAVSDLQAALREFAKPTPPKPDEPQGLGAVVEGADGMLWVRTTTGDRAPAWLYPQTPSRRHYAEIPVVRVLSEGVS